MENTMCVAKALYDMYYKNNAKAMDEMKMHKLMYFAQRESLIRHNRALFDGVFYGWKYGPVLKEVRTAYKQDAFSQKFDEVSEETKDLLQFILERYGSLPSWKLSSLSHGEFSWKKARQGLESGEDGNVKLLLDAMKVDATKELMNRSTAIA